MLFARKQVAEPTSRSIALDRLKMVVLADRDLEDDGELITMIKSDIIKVLCKYMDIGFDDLDIQICKPTPKENGGDGSEPRLKADIPFKSVKKRK